MAIIVLSCASWALWDSRVLPRGNVFNGRSGSRTGTRDVISLGNGPVLPYPLAGFPTIRASPCRCAAESNKFGMDGFTSHFGHGGISVLSMTLFQQG